MNFRDHFPPVKGAFTLIELIVVIAIISLLVAILLPALSRSRQLGQAAVCQSNLHSMCQSLLMYADNNDGRLPIGSYDEHSANEHQHNPFDAWIVTALNDLGSERIARCPVDASPYWTTPAPGVNRLRRLSYAANNYLSGTVPDREEYTVMTRVKRPSATIAWVELAERGELAAADQVHPYEWYSNPRPLAATEMQIDRHVNKANYGFLDGHSERTAFEETYLIKTPAADLPDVIFDHNKYDPALGW